MKKEVKIILPSFLLLIFTCVITLVYASFNTSMTIDGVATILSSSVEIKGTTYNNATGGASYQTPSYTKNTVTYPVSMPAGSSITFDLSVTNGTTANYEITNLVHSQTNLTINYSGQGCFLADTLNSKSTYNCNITITNETGSSINDTVITTYTYQEKNDYSLKHRMEVLANGIDQNIVTDMADDRLESNGTITYVGSNPDNYVLLEGSLWRIVNSDDSVTNSEGKAVGGIKLVRRDSLGKYVWRYTESGVNNGYGVADWSSSTLKTELNDLFYTSSSGTCYMTDGSASTSSCDFSSNGLNKNKLIENVTWKTGAGNPNSNASTLLRELKSNSKVSDNGCTTSAKSNSKCNTSPNGGFTSSSTGYVGLLSPSDFMYATSGGNTTSRASCLEMSGSSWNNYEDCYTTWLKTTAGTDWTLQPAIYSNDYSRVFVYNKTYVNNQSSKKAYIVRPSIYIKENTTLYSGEEGTEGSFKGLSGKGVNMLHLSTHGMYVEPENIKQKKQELNYDFLELITNDDDPVKEDIVLTHSFLVMSGGNSLSRREAIVSGMNDGILTAFEISQLDLSSVDIVALSACETGLGDIENGGVFGLQRGFKKAGVKTILMSLDKVDDEATKILMVEFYRNLMSGKSKHQSLKDAQAYLRQVDNGKYDKPEYWTSFILLDGLN